MPVQSTPDFVCEKCGHASTVAESRPHAFNPALVILVLECKSCGHRVTRTLDKWTQQPPSAEL